MQQVFYKNRLIDNFSINVLVTTDIEQDIIHSTIYQELCLGIVTKQSLSEYLNVMQSLTQRGDQGIILGCTEIGLLVDKNHTKNTLYDTTIIYALAAVENPLK
jgi:aspartate racemase